MKIDKYKEIIIAISIIIIIVCFYAIKYYRAGITKNDSLIKQSENTENIIENNTNETISKEEIIQSMQKGDNFAKLGNTIIYANEFDECIYVIDLKKKSINNIYKTENGVDKIYFDGKFIYILPYYYRGKGIYKVDLQGNASKIYEGSSIQMWLQDEKIYFVEQIGYDKINGTPQGNLSVMNKDGSDKKILIQNVKNYFYIVNDIIYYIDQTSRSIYSAKIDGTEQKEIAKGRNYITSANEKYLTYLDYSDGEKQNIIFIDNMKNIKIGRFGNINASANGTYIYTKNSIGENYEVENDYTLYSVNVDECSISKILKNSDPLNFLNYIYNNYAYFSIGDEMYRLNMSNDNPQKENIEMKYSYFINGKAYCIKSNEGTLTEIDILNLDNMNKEEIKF